MAEQVKVNREIFGTGENLLLCGSVMRLPEEFRALAGKVQCVYVDPPFMTGEKFMRRRPYVPLPPAIRPMKTVLPTKSNTCACCAA